MCLILLHSVVLLFLAFHAQIVVLFQSVCIANRKKKHQSSTDKDATAMESADTFHSVASTPGDQDRDYYNLPTTNRNVTETDQANYTQLSTVANDNHTYSHLNTNAGQ